MSTGDLPTAETTRIALDALTGLSERSTDGRLRDAIATVRSALWDEMEDSEPAPVSQDLTAEIDHVAEAVERRPWIIADTLDDHAPFYSADRDFVTCKCDGTLYDTTEWRAHVGRAATAALDEDMAHYASLAVTTPSVVAGGDPS